MSLNQGLDGGDKIEDQLIPVNYLPLYNSEPSNGVSAYLLYNTIFLQELTPVQLPVFINTDTNVHYIRASTRSLKAAYDTQRQLYENFYSQNSQDVFEKWYAYVSNHSAQDDVRIDAATVNEPAAPSNDLVVQGATQQAAITGTIQKATEAYVNEMRFYIVASTFCSWSHSKLMLLVRLFDIHKRGRLNCTELFMCISLLLSIALHCRLLFLFQHETVLLYYIINLAIDSDIPQQGDDVKLRPASLIPFFNIMCIHPVITSMVISSVGGKSTIDFATGMSILFDAFYKQDLLDGGGRTCYDFDQKLKNIGI